jgi:uncharacterized membrane protein YGL010W
VPTLGHYMARYDQEHTAWSNKLLHGLGIPMIFVGVLVAILGFWRLGLALFVLGWAMLFLGHRIEGNSPAFFQGPIYFLVGPLWVAKEIKDALWGRGRQSETSRPQ